MIRRRRTPDPIEGTEAELVAHDRRARRRAPRVAAAAAGRAHRVARDERQPARVPHRERRGRRRCRARREWRGWHRPGRGELDGLDRRSAVPAAAKSQKLTGDLAIVALAASLENLAVGTYQAGIDAATAGKLGAVPPAVVSFATTAQSQHKDHAAAWNSVLTGAGKKAITGVDLTVKKDVDTAFASVKDVPGLAMLALSLENGAAATYLAAIDAVKSPAGIKVAATIQPVEMQHAAVLNFLLGQYPVPDSFSKQTDARTTTDKIG